MGLSWRSGMAVPGDQKGVQHGPADLPGMRRDACMASGYTSNYGLCQWQPGDKFLREEFNQDNEKIDAALKAAEDRATAETGQVRTRLEAINYNLCNLLLQNDYEGKYTGYKKALIFDGFVGEVDRELSASLLLNSGSLILLLLQ